jgi:replicative DNA helicase
MSISKILEKKRTYELMFAACAMAEYSYISAEEITHVGVRKFWELFLSGVERYKAASEADILADVSRIVTDTPLVTKIDLYAKKFLKIGILAGIQKETLRIIEAVQEEDLDKALDALDILTANRSKILGETTQVNPVQLSEEFSENLEKSGDGIPTGLPLLDKLSGQLPRKWLSVWSARTSIGKTALLWQMARTAAKLGKKTLYISTESAGESLWIRACCGATKIDWRDVVTHKVSEEQIQYLRTASAVLADEYGDDLLVDDQARTISSIHQSIARVLPDFVIVDHLDEVEQPYELIPNRTLWLAQAIYSLRRLAKTFNCHMAVVHQLSRKGDERENHKPVLSDLRWSGDIEQKADMVFMLHREDVYADIPKKLMNVPVEIWQRKNRQGPRDEKIDVKYMLPEQWFTDAQF